MINDFYIVNFKFKLNININLKVYNLKINLLCHQLTYSEIIKMYFFSKYWNNI